MSENEKMVSKETQTKVDSLGSGMIMHDVHNDNASNDVLMEMQDAIVDANEANDATAEQAIKGGVSAAQFMYQRTRQMIRNYNIRPNDKCPCGSGLKYKNCCKDSGKYEGYHTV